MTGKDICPSCGMEKDEDLKDKALCYYCYMRGRSNTFKMVILSIFLGKDISQLSQKEAKKILDEDFKKLSPEQVLEEFNKLNFTKQKGNLLSMKKYLIKYTKFGILSASKERVKRVGRPKLLYRIKDGGRKLFIRYIDAWYDGHMLLIHEKHQKLKIGHDERERASSIRGKMLNDKKYNSFEFMFPQRLTSIPAK